MKKVLIYVLIAIMSFYLGNKVEFDFNAVSTISSDKIAIVNNDQRVDYLNSSYKFGDEFIKLVDNSDTKFDYIVVNNSDARLGMLSGHYAATITIPSNLTNSIISINSKSPTTAQITYEINSNLPTNKSEKVQDDIINELANFEDNLTYMYLYAIFEGLHNAQYGINTVYSNQESIYPFLEEISSINIVSNHQYELMDYNDENFSSIDITLQLKIFKEIIKFYKLNVANSVTIYKLETNNLKDNVDLAIKDFETNNDLLVKRIKNVKDTLTKLVKSNKQFYATDYSITDAKANIEVIILQYLSQLKIFNDISASSKVLTENGRTFNINKDRLFDNTSFTTYLQLIKARENYYTSVFVVDTCINSSTPDECMDAAIKDYKDAYAKYEAIISNFDMEEDYQTRLTYYLDNLEASALTSSESTPNVASTKIASEITNYEIKDTKESELITPTIEVNNYDMIGSLGYIEVNINNASLLDEIILEDLKLNNIENLSYVNVESSQDFYDVVINMRLFSKQIEITNIETNQITFGLSFNLVDPNVDGAFTFSYDDKEYTTNVAATSDIFTIDYKYNATTKKLDGDITYTRTERDDNDFVFVSNQLANYVDFKNASIVSADETLNSAFRFNNTGFTIINSHLPVNEKLSFKISLTINKCPANGIFIEDYTIDGQQYYIPQVINKAIIKNDRITIIDDPYYLSSESKIEHKEDDLDKNSLISPSEKIGLKYKFTYLNKMPVAIDQISVDYQLPSGEEAKLVSVIESDYVGILINRNVVDASFIVSDDLITIDFADSITTDEDINDKGYYEYDFELYFNMSVNDVLAINQSDKYFVTFDQVVVTYDDLDEVFINLAHDNLEFAFGEVKIGNVEYLVNEQMCDNGAKTLQECHFEEGETFKRTVTITNEGDIASGITLEDNLNEDVFEISPPEYQLISLAGEPREQFIPSDLVSLDNFSIPSNFKLVITQDIKVREFIYGDIIENNRIKLSQYSNYISESKAVINIAPLKLKIENVTFEQQVPDGLVSANESIIMEFDIKNASLNSTANYNLFTIENDLSGLGEEYEIISITDNNWNTYPIDSSQTPTYYELNESIKPGEAIRVRVCIHVGTIMTAQTQGTIRINVYKSASSPKVDDTYELTYGLSTASYEQMIKQQLADEYVVSNQTYNDALTDSTNVDKYLSNIDNTLSNLDGYLEIFDNYSKYLDNLTILNNQSISKIIDDINKFGLGYDSKDDEDYLTDYRYCLFSNEMSCQIFTLYNQIYANEEKAKNHFHELLNTIDPSIDYVIGYKLDSAGNETKNPVNIGADFNGYGLCLNPNSKLCELGILKRIDKQGEDTKNINVQVQKIIDNDIVEVDAQPYDIALQKVQESMLEEMDSVEVDNNELFDQKVAVYEENFKRISTYLDEVTSDSSYLEQIGAYKNAEDERLEVNHKILNNVYLLLPNSTLNGLPNKILYSFISSPIMVLGVDEGSQMLDKIKTIDENLTHIIIGLTIIMVVFILIYLFLNWRDDG